MAATGENQRPPAGRNRWPLTRCYVPDSYPRFGPTSDQGTINPLRPAVSADRSLCKLEAIGSIPIRPILRKPWSTWGFRSSVGLPDGQLRARGNRLATCGLWRRHVVLLASTYVCTAPLRCSRCVRSRSPSTLVEEITPEVGMSRWTLSEACRRGEFPHVKLPHHRRILIDRRQVAAFLDGSCARVKATVKRWANRESDHG